MNTVLAEQAGEVGSSLSLGDAHKGTGIGLGELLKGARERRGLTLQQLSQETKIPQRHLEALEHDDLAVSPGAFYRRAEVRAYARAVHLDQGLALAQLESALEVSAPHTIDAEPPSKARGRSLSRTQALILGGVVVAAVVLGRAVGGREQASDEGNPRSDPSPTLSGAPPSTQSAGTRTSGPAGVDQGVPTPLEQEVPGLPPGTVATPTIVPEAEAAALSDTATSDTELVVLTEPPGASVTVNGVGWGMAPVTIRYLAPGEKRIRASRDGYIATERVVTVTSGRAATVEIQLNSQP